MDNYTMPHLLLRQAVVQGSLVVDTSMFYEMYFV